MDKKQRQDWQMKHWQLIVFLPNKERERSRKDRWTWMDCKYHLIPCLWLIKYPSCIDIDLDALAWIHQHSTTVSYNPSIHSKLIHIEVTAMQLILIPRFIIDNMHTLHTESFISFQIRGRLQWVLIEMRMESETCQRMIWISDIISNCVIYLSIIKDTSRKGRFYLKKWIQNGKQWCQTRQVIDRVGYIAISRSPVLDHLSNMIGQSRNAIYHVGWWSSPL